jgi:membrane protease YdiL (CAAX protease family)
MTLNNIFFGTSGRLRSGWRFSVFVLGFAVTSIGIGAIGWMFFVAMPERFAPGTSAFLVANALLSMIPALVIGWLCGKYLEGLPFKALGAWFMEGWFRHLLFGLLIGALTVAFAVAIAWVFGGLRFEFNAANSGAIAGSLVVTFVIFAVAAAFEEALFRGYVFQTFTRSGLAWLAILLTSVPFAIVHLNNPSSGLISTLNTALAGIWFGVAYLKTRDLWFVWGLHLMWNWVQGSFFGVEVSGMSEIVKAPLMNEIDSGPHWLTGQDYGIEGGIACTIALIVSSVLLNYIPALKPGDEMLALTSPESEMQQSEPIHSV